MDHTFFSFDFPSPSEALDSPREYSVVTSRLSYIADKGRFIHVEGVSRAPEWVPGTRMWKMQSGCGVYRLEPAWNRPAKHEIPKYSGFHIGGLRCS